MKNKIATMREPLSKFWQVIFLGVTILTALSFLNGCGQSPESAIKKLYRPSSGTDVSSDAYYNFSSFAGTVWETKVKLALIDIKRYSNEHVLGLFPPEVFDPTHPRYSPIKDMKMNSVLPIGTRLRIEKLIHDSGVWGGVWVTATLKNDTNSIKKIFFDVDPTLLAKNQFIWAGSSTSTNWGVNPDMLEK